MINEKKRMPIYYTLIFISFFVLTFVWYANNSWEVLMGDDLLAVGSFKENGFWKTIFNPYNISLGKIRPVSTVLLYIVYIFGGTDYTRYYCITRIFIAVASFCIFILCTKIDIKAAYAYIISIFIITCPFSAYGAWQMLGILETFSLLCCVLCLYYQYKIIFCHEKRVVRINAIYCTLFFSLLIFNAERFMYLAAVFILIAFLSRNINLKDKFFLLILYLLPIVCRSLILHLAGASALGTGRGSILTLFSTLGAYTLKGFVNMLGFSLGDQWHGGFNLLELPLLILIVSSLRVVIFIGVGFNVLTCCLKNRQSKENIVICIMYIFSLTSLFSYALVGATHGEDRFLWIPYVYYLIALARYLSNIQTNRLYILGTILSAVTILLSNYNYLVNKVHVHFRYSQEMAQTCIDNIYKLENYELAKNVCCINSNDYFWVFGDQYFFQFYLNNNIDVFYFDTYESIDEELRKEDTLIVFPDMNYPIPYGVAACWDNNYK